MNWSASNKWLQCGKRHNDIIVRKKIGAGGSGDIFDIDYKANVLVAKVFFHEEDYYSWLSQYFTPRIQIKKIVNWINDYKDFRVYDCYVCNVERRDLKQNYLFYKELPRRIQK